MKEMQSLHTANRHSVTHSDIPGTSMEQECDEPALGNTRKPNRVSNVNGNEENINKSESFKEEVTRTQHPVELYGERLALLSIIYSESVNFSPNHCNV